MVIADRPIDILLPLDLGQLTDSAATLSGRTMRPQMKRVCPLFRPISVVLMLAQPLISACTGSVIGPLASIGGDPPLIGNGPNSPGDTSPGGCDAIPRRLVSRRLSRSEYNRTVRDIFGVAGQPANSLPPDPVKSFDNSADLLSTSPLHIEQFLVISGRVIDAALADPVLASRVVVCDPAGTSADACSREIFRTVGRRLARRPLTAEELTDVEALASAARADGDTFVESVKVGLRGLLMSPQFLFRELPDSAAGGGPRPVDEFVLATRLAYLVWGSAPDDRLLDLAEQGALSPADRLTAELKRMLSDPRTSSLTDDFAHQWLALAKLQDASPDPVLFPGVDKGLLDDMRSEVMLGFSDLLKSNRGPIELVRGRQTFLNERLARHYGRTDVLGSQFRRVDVDPTQRSGVLTQAGILTMTSTPKATHLIRRGVWVASALLCAEPPPPPANIPVLGPAMPGETQRQQLERHRADPACATCHELIDPLGFGLESYDPVGRYRTTDENGQTIDSTGTLPGGRAFRGAIELAPLLERGPEFSRCLTSKLLTYALGSEFAAQDCHAQKLAPAIANGESMESVLDKIVHSDAFTQRWP